MSNSGISFPHCRRRASLGLSFGGLTGKEAREEGLVSELGVVLLEELPGGRDQLHGNEFEAIDTLSADYCLHGGDCLHLPTLLKAGDDGSNQAALATGSARSVRIVEPRDHCRFDNRLRRGKGHTWTPSGLIAMKLEDELASMPHNRRGGENSGRGRGSACWRNGTEQGDIRLLVGHLGFSEGDCGFPITKTDSRTRGIEGEEQSLAGCVGENIFDSDRQMVGLEGYPYCVPWVPTWARQYNVNAWPGRCQQTACPSLCCLREKRHDIRMILF